MHRRVECIGIIMLLTIGCVSTEDTADTQQSNCTSPPIVAPDSAGRPTRAHAECMPAFDALPETQLAVYNESLRDGTTTDRWYIGCLNSTCNAHWWSDDGLLEVQIDCSSSGCLIRDCYNDPIYDGQWKCHPR